MLLTIFVGYIASTRIVLNEIHRIKTHSPILVMLAGIFMLTNDVLPSKAYFPMLVTLLGISILVKFLQFPKAEEAILLTELGITYIFPAFFAGYFSKVILFLSNKTPPIEQ